MNSFIEEFYYGNIDPQARSFEQNKKMQHNMQTLNESEGFLTDKLSGEEKKRFMGRTDEQYPQSSRRDCPERPDLQLNTPKDIASASENEAGAIFLCFFEIGV